MNIDTPDMGIPAAVHTIIDGRPWWVYADGTELPVISGGDGSGDGDGGGGGGGDGEGGDGGAGDGGGDGGSGDDGSGGDGDSTDWKAEAEKWKGLSRKHEDSAKKNAGAAKELDKIRAESMSETEKAVEAAKAEGRQAALAETGQLLAAAEIKAALTGIVPDPAMVVEDLNLAKYVTDTGGVDDEAVKALAEKYSGIASKPNPADLKQGARGDHSKPAQLTQADLKGMSSEDIVKARAEGRLNEMQGLPVT